MKTIWIIQQLHKHIAMLNEILFWFKRTGRLLPLIQMRSWTLTMDLHISTSMMTSGLTTLLQNEYQHFMDEHKQASIETYMESLQWPCKEGEVSLQWIVKGDETCVYHYEPAMKHQSTEWKHTSLSRTKKLKNRPSAGKVIFLLFWNIKAHTRMADRWPIVHNTVLCFSRNWNPLSQ
jgi:hypothetical protein